MAATLKKITKDVIGQLKKSPDPEDKKATLWQTLNNQVNEEGEWNEDLLGSVESKIEENLSKINDKELRVLWEQTEAAMENYDAEADNSDSKVKLEIREEILNRILEEIDSGSNYIDDEERSYFRNDDVDDEDDLDDGFKFDDDDLFKDDDLPFDDGDDRF